MYLFRREDAQSQLPQTCTPLLLCLSVCLNFVAVLSAPPINLLSFCPSHWLDETCCSNPTKISCFWTFFFCSVSALVSNSGLWISFVGIQICSRYWWYQVVLFYFIKKIALELDYSLACHDPRMLVYIVSSNLCPGLKGNFTLLQKRKSKTK